MEKTKEINERLAYLDYAKRAVKELIDNPLALVDMHDIEYWASEVKRTREIIKNLL